MSTAQILYSIPELLQKAGATLRGRRSSCPRCQGQRTVSFNDEVYFCHHAGCDFSGNNFQLAKALGLGWYVSPEEVRERRRARKAAQVVAARIKSETFSLRVQHHELLDIQSAAEERLKADPNDAVGRDMKSFAERERLEVLAELALLEDTPPAERLAFINSGKPKREKAIAGVIEAGGLYRINNGKQQFIEVGC